VEQRRREVGWAEIAYSGAFCVHGEQLGIAVLNATYPYPRREPRRKSGGRWPLDADSDLREILNSNSNSWGFFLEARAIRAKQAIQPIPNKPPMDWAEIKMNRGSY
jgi:hypothetical protein